MIGPHQVMIGLVAGAVLVGLGAVPGLFQGLVDGVRNFIRLATARFPLPSHQSQDIRQPKWLAGLGAALVVATVLASLSA